MNKNSPTNLSSENTPETLVSRNVTLQVKTPSSSSLRYENCKMLLVVLSCIFILPSFISSTDVPFFIHTRFKLLVTLTPLEMTTSHSSDNALPTILLLLLTIVTFTVGVGTT